MPYPEARKTGLERQAGRQTSERPATSKAKPKGARDRAAEKSRASSTRERTGEKAVVQLRLRGEESTELEYSMRVLALGPTSEALREGLRLLHREAFEVAAEENIQSFHQGGQAPLPDGVVPAGDADLSAADNSEW